MLYNERFKGHLSKDDPRTPLTAAAGCVWPTVPAHRYLLTSSTAYGALEPLNSQGILIEKVSTGAAHDDCQFNSLSAPPPIFACIATKTWNEDTEGYDWRIQISAYLCGLIDFTVERPEEKCNRNILLGDHSCPSVPGGTGSDFTMEQVEWDQTEPP